MSLELGRLGRLVDARDLHGITDWVDEVVLRAKRDVVKDTYGYVSPQHRIGEWVARVFPVEVARNVHERALRAVEEVVELAQACAVNVEEVHRLVDYVFDRPKGEPAKELAGSFVTLYALAVALDVDADIEFELEVARIQDPEVIERVRTRQKEKREAIVASARAKCHACSVEAEFGTKENPHPIPADFHTCRMSAPDTCLRPPSFLRGVGVHRKNCTKFRG